MDLLKLVAAGALLASACVPDLDTDESTVGVTRVLAIQAEPAEARPGGSAPIRYRALVADGSGIRADVGLTWFQCLAQKPLAELGPVSPDCLRTDSGKLMQFGQGQDVQGMLPNQACSLFGPNPPLAVMGQPPGRPVDPDQTGGYKQPIVVAPAGAQVALYEQRIFCGLANVAPSVSVEFTQRYHANTNPSVAEVRAIRATGSTVLAPEQALEVAPGERIELELAWPSCPLVDSCGDGVCGPDETAQSCPAECQPLLGCGGQERYLQYDREAGELVVQRETMRVAWYATAGSYDDERTGAEVDATAPTSRNAYVAPTNVGPATLWVVLRDSRGGVGFRSLPVLVR